MSKNKNDNDVMPATFPAKWAKILKDMPEFRDTVEKMSVEELKKVIVQSEGNLYTINQEKDNDAKLNGARELCKEYSIPYKEAARCQQAKIQYAVFLLQGKGVDIDNRE